jgi:hypothetical protein
MGRILALAEFFASRELAPNRVNANRVFNRKEVDEPLTLMPFGNAEFQQG